MNTKFVRICVKSLMTGSVLTFSACSQSDDVVEIAPTRNDVKSVQIDTSTEAKTGYEIPSDMTPEDAFATGMKTYNNQNHALAKQYFVHAAEGNLKSANVYLGLIYSQNGELKDDVKAVKNFQKALEDEPRLTPLVMLARAYKDGIGVNQDTAAALQYYYRVKLSVKDKNSPIYLEASEFIFNVTEGATGEALEREKNMLKKIGVPAKNSLENVIVQSHLDNSIYVAPDT